MKKYLILSFIQIFFYCGNSFGSSTAYPQPQDFEERIGLQLAFKGIKCAGGEQVEIQEGDEIKTVTCERGQWQITIDNVNTCNDEGSCTEIFVYPFIGKLILMDESEEQSDYGFSALTQVNCETTQNIQDHKVRFTMTGRPQILLR